MPIQPRPRAETVSSEPRARRCIRWCSGGSGTSMNSGAVVQVRRYLLRGQSVVAPRTLADTDGSSRRIKVAYRPNGRTATDDTETATDDRRHAHRSLTTCTDENS